MVRIHNQDARGRIRITRACSIIVLRAVGAMAVVVANGAHEGLPACSMSHNVPGTRRPASLIQCRTKDA